MKLEDLIDQFSRIEHALVGRGPKHPTEPRADLVEVLATYLKFYPQLHRYPNYLRFLELYGGAYIADEDEPSNDFLMIYGIGDFDDPMGNALDANGFHLFVNALVKPSANEEIWLVFAFDTKMEGETVYLQRTCQTWPYSKRTEEVIENPYEPYADSFLTWLEEVVRRGGRFL